MPLEPLEARSLLAALGPLAAFATGGQAERSAGAAAFADGAYQLLHDRVRFHDRHFFVYHDADSGFNRGAPSGFFAGDFTFGDFRHRPDLLERIDIDASAIFDAGSPTGSSADPKALDRQRGTVMRITIPR